MSMGLGNVKTGLKVDQSEEELWYCVTNDDGDILCRYSTETEAGAFVYGAEYGMRRLVNLIGEKTKSILLDFIIGGVA